MNKVNHIIKKISLLLAAILLLNTVLAGETVKTDAATNLHRYFVVSKSSGGHKDGTVVTAKWGLKNAKGKVVMKPKYTYISCFSDGIASASSGQYGDTRFYINTKGKKVLSKVPAGSYYQNGVAIASTYNKTTYQAKAYLVDKNGKKLTKTSYSEIKRLKNGCFDASFGYQKPHDIIDKNGKVLVASFTGYVKESDYGFMITEQDSSKQSIYDLKGNLIMENAEGGYSLCGNAIWYGSKDGKDKTVYDWSGKEVGKVNAKVSLTNGASGFVNGLCPATDGSGKYGYVDSMGKFAIKAVYSKVGTFHNNLALVTKDGKNYVINNKGKVVTRLPNSISGDLQYSTGDSTGPAYIEFTQNGKKGLLSAKTGKTVISAKYDLVSVRNRSDADAYILALVSTGTSSKYTVFEMDGFQIGSYTGDDLVGLTW